MLRALWTSAVVATVGSALLLTPANIDASGHGGGGHGGGGHGGGGHGGSWGGHGGGWGGGYRGGYYGGWGVGLGWGGWGYPGYYGGYYSSPGYYYGSSPYYYSSDYSTPVYSDDGSYSYYPSNNNNQAINNNQGNMNNDDARFVVHVPDPNAEIWFQNYKTKQQGQVRFFESDRLDPNSNYTFTVRAKWNQNGKQMDQTRQVNAKAGNVYNVDFNRPAGERIPNAPNRNQGQQQIDNPNNNNNQPGQVIQGTPSNENQRPIVNGNPNK
jgi:uncharacterized protein (TIGR03000 family)